LAQLAADPSEPAAICHCEESDDVAISPLRLPADNEGSTSQDHDYLVPFRLGVTKLNRHSKILNRAAARISTNTCCPEHTVCTSFRMRREPFTPASQATWQEGWSSTGLARVRHSPGSTNLVRLFGMKSQTMSGRHSNVKNRSRAGIENGNRD
jgi:hypothetical protein